ncbi:unnamed protein product [Brassica napus]|uniref:(rape) hypothetical protein n=1 Tax=Brassica napus TaxID=3708 RepID=A0A816K5B6_BRANA|nr:unnamed protein product [Brassica napus]
MDPIESVRYNDFEISTNARGASRGSEETDPRREMTAFTDDSKDETRSKRRSNSYDEEYDFDGSEDEIAAKKMDETKKKTKYSR